MNGNRRENVMAERQTAL